eukprot:COSAG02_NODE_28073_length_597_cov_0.654618_1_plen_37_part_10
MKNQLKADLLAHPEAYIGMYTLPTLTPIAELIVPPIA